MKLLLTCEIESINIIFKYIHLIYHLILNNKLKIILSYFELNKGNQFENTKNQNIPLIKL
jgi:hypothetical protein